MNRKDTRRHREITLLFITLANRGSEEIVERHKLNWNGLEVPAGWRPLFNLPDFTQEGAKMHHCVGGYFRETGWWFAHLEHNEARATIQFRILPESTWEISQLYGVCNEPGSEDLKVWASSCLDKMVKVHSDQAARLATGT